MDQVAVLISNLGSRFSATKQKPIHLRALAYIHPFNVAEILKSINISKIWTQLELKINGLPFRNSKQ